MPPAVAAAGIGAAASIGGGLLSSSAQKKAASQVSDASVQTAQMNNALARDIYGQNSDILNPFVMRGNRAGEAINALLGLGGGPEPMQLPQAANNNAFASYAGYAPVGGFGDPREPQFNRAFSESGGPGFANPFGGYMGYPGFQMNQPQANQFGATMQPAQGPGSAQEAAENAFDIFRNHTGYRFRVNEGQDAMATRFGARGIGQSGAAVKALEDYRQNTASNEFGNYLGYLSNQQGVGLSGASAVAGVGQNYVNNVSANNNSAGTGIANAALMRGSANSNLFGGIANAAGQFAGSAFSPSSFQSVNDASLDLIRKNPGIF